MEENLRTINLNTEVVISQDDWTAAFGVTGYDAIEKNVRGWARLLLTEALAANDVKGYAR